MDILSLILGLVVLSVLWHFLDKAQLKRADKLFEKRVAYVLDEIEKRKSENK